MTDPADTDSTHGLAWVESDNLLAKPKHKLQSNIANQLGHALVGRFAVGHCTPHVMVGHPSAHCPGGASADCRAMPGCDNQLQTSIESFACSMIAPADIDSDTDTTCQTKRRIGNSFPNERKISFIDCGFWVCERPTECLQPRSRGHTACWLIKTLNQQPTVLLCQAESSRAAVLSLWMTLS